jgi:hypothetical protein
LLAHERKVDLQLLYFRDQHQNCTTSGSGLLATRVLQSTAPVP